MRCASLEPGLLLLVYAGLAFPQQIPSAASSDGLKLLTRVAQHYADARSYRIEMTEEQTVSNEYLRQWWKSVLIAGEAPGGRYYFEGHSGMGNAIKVSDGKTVWKYRADQLRYTAKPVASTSGDSERIWRSLGPSSRI